MAFAPQSSLNIIKVDPESMYRDISGWWYKIQSLEGLLNLNRKWIPKKYLGEVRRLEQGIKRR